MAARRAYKIMVKGRYIKPNLDFRAREDLKKHAMWCDRCALADIARECCPIGRYMVDPWFPKPKPDEGYINKQLPEQLDAKLKLRRHQISHPQCNNWGLHYLDMCEAGKALARAWDPLLIRFDITGDRSTSIQDYLSGSLRRDK